MTSLPVTHGLLGLRWWPVPGAVFCYLFGVRHHLQSRVWLPFIILERNTAPNVLCPRPSWVQAGWGERL